MHGLFRLGLDRHGGIGVELPVAFAADDQIAVAVVAQPPDSGLGGDAAVDDDQGAGRRVECLEHAGQRAVLATLPAKTFERRTKPLASSIRPRVSSGQSLRFSFECPRPACGCAPASPSK